MPQGRGSSKRQVIPTALKTDPVTDIFQLMHYNGVSSEAAVVDHVIGLAFEYFGDPVAADPASSGDRSRRAVDDVRPEAAATERAIDGVRRR